MKYHELPKQWQKIAKQWVIDELNQIEKEAETNYIVSEKNEFDKIFIAGILTEKEYTLEYSKEYPEGILSC